MQGLPLNLSTAKGLPSQKKVEGSALGQEGLLSANGGEGAIEGKAAQESKNTFASLFANLFAEGEGKEVGPQENGKNKDKEIATLSAEGMSKSSKVPLDVLLKNKTPETVQANMPATVANDKVLSPDIIKNLSRLIPAEPVATEQGAHVSSENKKTATTTDLAELMKMSQAGKEPKAAKEVDGIVPQGSSDKTTRMITSGPEEVVSEVSFAGAEAIKEEEANPLDFLIKEAKVADHKKPPAPPSAKRGEEEAAPLKVGLSSEDFLTQMEGKKEAKAVRNFFPTKEKAEDFDPKALVQKQNQLSIKSYGQGQNVLNDNIIKSTKDFAFKDSKLKSEVDELKNPDLKVGAHLSSIKENVIPMAQNKEGQGIESKEATKVLDLSNIGTSNPSEIIKRISDYVEQNQFGKTQSLDLNVKHDALGQFKIQVQRPMGSMDNQIEMKITTATPEGHDFFVRNEMGLMKNLSQAGISLSDLRIVSGSETMSFTQSDSRGSQQSFAQQSDLKEFMSFSSGHSSHGSDRRKELWEQARASQERRGA